MPGQVGAHPDSLSVLMVAKSMPNPFLTPKIYENVNKMRFYCNFYPILFGVSNSF